MATSNIQYCTHRDIKDTYPNINDFDDKKPIYGWTSTISNWYDSAIDLYYATNAGLVTQLFFNGAEVDKITYNTTETTKLDGALTPSATVFYVDASHGLEADDIVKIDNEYIRVVSVSDDTITITTPTTNRGIFGTTAQHHANNTSVYKIIDANVDVSDASVSGDPHSFIYDTHLDMCILITESNPADNLLQAGEDFTTLVTRIAKRASRMIDSKIGYRVTDTQIKDREGNYPDIIVRAASLQSVILLLTSEDPTNPIIEPFKEELAEIVDGINAGTIVILGNQRTMDAAKGIIREVSVNTSSDLRPVELTGHYSGSAYELLKVYIDSGENGVIGTTKMTVKGKDSTKLKNTVLVDSEVITGDYQSLGISDMKIRWSGDNDAAITTADDEYEIEIFGHNLDSSTPGQVGNIKMTRR